MKEYRIEQNKSSIFIPTSTADPDELNAIRAHSTWSWELAPVIAQSWDHKQKGLGFVIRAKDWSTQPTAVAFTIDGKVTMVETSQWHDSEKGGVYTLIDREDLERAVANSQNLSITVFAGEPLTGTYHSADLVVFKSVTEMYSNGTFSGGTPTDLTPSPVETQAQKPSPTTANGKVDRKDYLQSKVQEVSSMCHDQIIATAKDPTSVQFLGDYSYAFGRALTRNWIFVSFPIMGRNSYGAVLRHTMTCSVSCPPGKPCVFQSLDDEH